MNDCRSSMIYFILPFRPDLVHPRSAVVGSYYGWGNNTLVHPQCSFGFIVLIKAAYGK